MDDYWAAWRVVLVLAVVVLKPLLKRALIVVAAAGWIAGECYLLAIGEYWQAATVYAVSLIGGLLLGGHLTARMLMKNKEPE